MYEFIAKHFELNLEAYQNAVRLRPEWGGPAYFPIRNRHFCVASHAITFARSSGFGRPAKLFLTRRFNRRFHHSDATIMGIVYLACQKRLLVFDEQRLI